MTHVVTESCIRCKYTDCVDVCPVDCFREGPNFLTIDPDECIDCAVCIPECPVNAIMPEEDVPADQQHMIKLNAELCAHRLAEHHQAQAGAARRRRVERPHRQAVRTDPLIGQDREPLTGHRTTAERRMISTDAVVIGAGPVGLFQVFQLGLQEIHCELIDALPHARRPVRRAVSRQADLRHSGHPGVQRPRADRAAVTQIAPMRAGIHLGRGSSRSMPARRRHASVSHSRRALPSRRAASSSPAASAPSSRSG